MLYPVPGVWTMPTMFVGLFRLWRQIIIIHRLIIVIIIFVRLRFRTANRTLILVVGEDVAHSAGGAYRYRTSQFGHKATFPE